MTGYCRPPAPGATWFFTANLAQRGANALLIERIDLLRKTVAAVKARHPFRIVAMVVLPDHLHAVWTLPPGDLDIGKRWGLIKAGFARRLPRGEPRSASRNLRGERGISQRRFWDHLIRDEADLAAHCDYVHYNPVKHGLVAAARDWPYSSFHRCVRNGIYADGWGIARDLGVRAFGEQRG
ncbi:transposase [Lysobacter sp. Root983]|uniref:REP-associated tyrosine transposase n=1 Tax=Lysobacter sp. Root983 TaxID=1736613 RepID=UPI00070A7C27|nr:transposase [Lysobacter sp. Root983]KRD77167.1 transposase [Lysobacter sp. Root983]